MLDRLNGATGAVPHSQIVAQAGLTLHHLGAHIDATWKSAYFVDGDNGSPISLLRFADVGIINLKTFADVGKMPNLVKAWPILAGARIEANVANVFDVRPKVVNALGVVPIAEQAAFLDPRGRVVTLSLRKKF